MFCKWCMQLIFVALFSGCVELQEINIEIERDSNLSLVSATEVESDFNNYLNLGGLKPTNYFIRFQHDTSDHRYNEQSEFYNEIKSSDDLYIKIIFSSDTHLIHKDEDDSYTRILDLSVNSCADLSIGGYFDFLEDISHRANGNYTYNLYIPIPINKSISGTFLNQIKNICFKINDIQSTMFGITYSYSSNDVTISASDIEAVLAQIPENNTTDTNTTENNDTNSSGG